MLFSFSTPIAHHFLSHGDEVVHFFSMSLRLGLGLCLCLVFLLRFNRCFGTRLFLHDSIWHRVLWGEFAERLCLTIVHILFLGLSQEFDWIKFMALLPLLFLDVFLRGDNVGVQGVVGLVLHDVLVVRWVHVSRLVAIIRVEWWIRSLIRLCLQFCLLLDLLLRFLLLLLLRLLLLVLGWLFVHGPGAFLGLLILEVSL